MLHAASRGENVPLQQGKKKKGKTAARAYVLNIIFLLSIFPAFFSLLFWARGVQTALASAASLSRRYQILPQPSALQTVCWSGTADERGRRSGGSQVLPDDASPLASLRSPTPLRAAKAYLIKAEICILRPRKERAPGRLEWG